MEPFSLLPFLQTLLRANLTPSQGNENTTETNENATTTPPANSVPSSYKEENTNACLQFFSLHDERVKRTKRP